MKPTLALFVFAILATICVAKPHICPRDGSIRKCFAYFPVDGCLCTAPGVCENTKADVCSVCNNQTVFSFEAKKACDAQDTKNSTQVPHTKICTPSDRLIRCFAYRPVDGCICSAPDVCQKGRADPCSVCAGQKVYSFTPESSC